MRITVIALARDEEGIMPFFLRHYHDWVDEILVYDHQSTDRTRDIVSSFPKARWQSYKTNGLRDDIHANMKSKAYQNGGLFPPNPPVSGDWFINVDCDEFAYHPDMRGYLSGCEADGVTLPLIEGFEMVGDNGLPPDDGVSKLTDVIKFGVPWGGESKLVVVHKDCDVNYHPGAHICSPGGRYKLGRPAEIKLFHYKWLGRDYIQNKLAWAASTLSEENIRYGWGWHVRERGWVGPHYDQWKALRTQVVP